ncbi:MAG: glycoside hydrolase [Sphingomonas sp.]
MRAARLLLASGLLPGLLAAMPAPAQAVPPPAALGLDPFYTRYLDAGGIPVTASARTPPQALAVARDIIDAMLAERPDLRAQLVADHVRVAIMAPDESTLDLPEQRGWKKPARDDPRLTPCERKQYDSRIGRLTDRTYWGGRARGMAGPLTSAAAENLLGLPRDRYAGQNIFVHEFAHMILRAMQARDPLLHAELRQAYADAMVAHRWEGEYAAVSPDEYWSIGTQIWFNTSQLVAFDGRRILSHQDLEAYDPRLYRALGKVYGASHHIVADIWYLHPARIPPGPPPRNTAEVC